MSVWTNRDWDLVETLCCRVRLLAVRQIAAGWWPRAGSLRVARRRLRILCAAGLIHRTTINAHPPFIINRPLATWSPDQTEPDCEWIAHQAKRRWCLAATPQEVVYAGKRAANLFGSSAGTLPKLEHRDHDLLLGAVYVQYRLQRPEEAAAWRGEDVFPKAGYRIKDPDAFLLAPDGGILRVIESAGRYSATQVESFHDHCVQHNLPYELW